MRPTDRPTRDEQQHWEAEANAFAYKPGNPQAPQNSIDYRSWGIPREKLPPPDAFAYVMAHYREHEQSLRVHDKGHRDYVEIHPAYRWSFAAACMAHFLWFRSPAGAAWIMGLYGVEEVQPFYDGYSYFWIDQTGKAMQLAPPQYQVDRFTERKKLVAGVELRIFREWERMLDPPCSQQRPGPVEEMKQLLLSYRNPLVKTEPHLPNEQVFYWVSEVLRDWLLEPKPDREWPTRKVDRISGMQWVQQLDRGPNTKFFEALEKIATYKGRAYRLRDNNGGVYWCGGKEIRCVPLKDLYLDNKLMNAGEVEVAFRCTSCQKLRACLPHTGTAKLCCHCYSVEMDQNDRPTLERCTMDRECKNCPDMISSPQDLVTLKNRLNRPARTGPVPR
jgi:hypothetical protein